MTQEERINILNIFERLGAETICADCIFRIECLSKKKCIYDMAHDLIENDDSEPVIHGHWVKHDIGKGILMLSECSVCEACVHICEKNCALAYENYCPNCGARMDEEDE